MTPATDPSLPLGVNVLPVVALLFAGPPSLVPDLLHEDTSASSEKIVVRATQTFICLNIIGSSKSRLFPMNFTTRRARSRPRRHFPGYIPGGRGLARTVNTRANTIPRLLLRTRPAAVSHA